MWVLINILKKSTKRRLKKKKKGCNYSATWTNQNGTIALATIQSLEKINGSLHQIGHYRGIASFFIVSRRKSTNG